jgi:large subunit ribosomal protein L15e
MAKSLYHNLRETWRKPDKGFQSINWQRHIEWRKGASFERVERPLRLDRARALGYKAKQGIVVVRARVRRGGLRKKRFTAGRAPSKMGVNKITMRKNIQWIAEERTARKYPNMQVLNSYWVGEDGRNKYYEVILADPSHPSIAKDKQYAYLTDPSNKRRVLRGRTSAGQKARGLRKKGIGSEHTRPSVKKSHRRDKDKRKIVNRKNYRKRPN